MRPRTLALLNLPLVNMVDIYGVASSANQIAADFFTVTVILLLDAM